MHLQIDNLRGPEIHALLQEHLDDMAQHSPPESVHALDIEALRHPDITFWTAWEQGALLGCGALKALGDGRGELKSMRTAAGHLRKGVASALLQQVLASATERGYTQLLLETGTTSPFDPARRLYERAGFVYRGPFAGYSEDRFSVFMVKAL
jgi:putative acetyltransferase